VYTSKLPQLFRKEFVTKIKIQTELANVVEENKLVTFKAARYSFKRNTSFGWESLLSHLLRYLLQNPEFCERRIQMPMPLWHSF
jgi:hypothetical protein